jgi:cytochrome c
MYFEKPRRRHRYLPAAHHAGDVRQEMWEETMRRGDLVIEPKVEAEAVTTKALRMGAILTAAAAATGLIAGAARADGDPVKGKAAFVRQCAICHTIEKGGDNRFGPNLFGVVGRTAGIVPGYSYTNAFKTRAKWEWTEDAIGSWMMFPSTMVPGTAMGAFQGIAERDRDDLVAYLATLK